MPGLCVIPQPSNLRYHLFFQMHFALNPTLQTLGFEKCPGYNVCLKGPGNKVKAGIGILSTAHKSEVYENETHLCPEEKTPQKK